MPVLDATIDARLPLPLAARADRSESQRRSPTLVPNLNTSGFAHRDFMVLAPAKLNLFLEILGRRPDGYHEIETVAVAIDWMDKLTVKSSAEPGIRLVCNDPVLPTDDRNLVVRAGRRLLGAAGLDGQIGLDVQLEKHIPLQAGLGGGSSDAAAMLRATSELLDLKLSRDRLATLAAEIGSDLPFFLGGPTAICRGRGEALEPFELSPAVAESWCFVVVKPPMGLNTAEVYLRLGGMLDQDQPGGPLGSRAGQAAEVREALQSGDRPRLAAALFNRLEPPAETMAWQVTELRQALLESGAIASRMTGSGSAVFALVRDAVHGAEVLERFRLLWPSRCRAHQEEDTSIRTQIVRLHGI